MVKKATVKKTTKEKQLMMNTAVRDVSVKNATLLRTEVIRRLIGDTQRDIDSECGYPIDITETDYRKMFDRNGVAARVVKILPDECWTNNPYIFETEDSTETEFEKKLNLLLKKRNVFHYLHRIDILSGIGRFGILLMGINDGKNLNDPVDGINLLTGESEGGKERQLLYLKPFDESVVRILTKETNPASPRFGYPVMYSIVMEDTTASQGASTTVSVHWTRILHVADDREMSDVNGVPRMQNVYNHLLDFKKILGGSGEMFWKGGFPGLSFEVNPNLENVTMDTTSIKEEMELYSNGLQRYLALDGVAAKSLAPQVSDPDSHITTLLKAIAVSKGIPYRIFLGSEQAQLASSQDKETWNGRVAKRQKDYLTPLVIRSFIDRMMAFGVLPIIEEYEVEWSDLNMPTDKDKADVAKIKTEALKSYVQGGVDALVPPREYMTIVLEMDTEEVDIIEQAAAEYDIIREEKEVVEFEKQKELMEAQGDTDAENRDV